MPNPETPELPVGSDDLLAVLGPVVDWYQSDEDDPRPALDIVRDVVDDLQRDRADVLHYRAALERIRDEFARLNGMECDRSCGRCIRCIASTALGAAANAKGDSPPVGG